MAYYITRATKLLQGAFSKSLRRQKEKRLIGSAKIFFKDGSTKFGRQRMDRALSSIYGYKNPLRPERSPGLKKAIRKYNIKGKSKRAQSKIAFARSSYKKKKDKENMELGLWAIKKGYV
jgi:hypothetical protein